MNEDQCARICNELSYLTAAIGLLVKEQERTNEFLYQIDIHITQLS